MCGYAGWSLRQLCSYSWLAACKVQTSSCVACLPLRAQGAAMLCLNPVVLSCAHLCNAMLCKAMLIWAAPLLQLVPASKWRFLLTPPHLSVSKMVCCVNSQEFLSEVSSYGLDRQTFAQQLQGCGAAWSMHGHSWQIYISTSPSMLLSLNPRFPQQANAESVCAQVISIVQLQLKSSALTH